MTPGVVSELGALIADIRGGWTGPVIETALLGADEPESIARLLAGWTAEHLGSPPAKAEWYHASSGVVVGWRLEDGRRVVVKAHEPRCDATQLTLMSDVQRRLVASGFPCAAPLLGATPCGSVLATAETMIDDPGPSIERDLDVNVTALLRFIHNAGSPTMRSDVARNAIHGGGELCDSLALVAERVISLDTSTPVIGHLDWSARNVRWSSAGLSAVFDLDSIGVATEATIVGRASVTWATTMELEDRPLGGRADFAAYLEAYQTARGRPFTLMEIRAAIGGAAASLCDAVRREVAWGISGPAHDGLEQHGDELFDILGVALE